MDSTTHHALTLLAIRRSQFGAFRRASRTFAAWARSGATPFNAYRAATQAFHNL